jgi:hypothetical protein
MNGIASPPSLSKAYSNNYKQVNHPHHAKKTGLNVLKIYAIDPGVILDRITISTGNKMEGYGLNPETKVLVK